MSGKRSYQVTSKSDGAATDDFELEEGTDFSSPDHLHASLLKHGHKRQASKMYGTVPIIGVDAKVLEEKVKQHPEKVTLEKHEGVLPSPTSTSTHPAIAFLRQHSNLIQALILFLVFFVAIVMFCSVPDEEESEVHFDYIGVSAKQPFPYQLDSDLPMDKVILHLWVSVLSHVYSPGEASLETRADDSNDTTIYYLNFTLMGERIETVVSNGTSVTVKNFYRYASWQEQLGAIHDKLARKNRLLHDIKDTHEWVLSDDEREETTGVWIINITTNSQSIIPMKLVVEQLGPSAHYEVLLGAIILVAVYGLIITEVLHRTAVAMVGSFAALAVLSVIHSRPSFTEVVSWIDYETLVLLFGMMMMVGIFAETGFFEWCAVKAYKISGGKLWNLTVALCLFTAVVSAFLDNVTTILLVAPVTIRLCKVINISDPIDLILAEVMFSNIGGTATPIGDPPNILIVNSPAIKATGIVTFGGFVLHVTPGVILAMLATFGILYFRIKKLEMNPHDPLDIEIQVWKKSLKRMKIPVTAEEKLVKEKLEQYIQELERMKQQQTQPQNSTEADAGYETIRDEEKGEKEKEEGGEGEGEGGGKVLTVEELEKKYVIHDVPLFIKCCFVLICVICLFFIHSFVNVHLNLAWIALIGAMSLLLLSGIKEMDKILEKIELSTLLFFGGLFVLMRTLEELGVMSYIADATASLIEMVPEGNMRISAAVILIIWVGAFASAFIDNIPFTQTLLPVVVRLAQSNLGLPYEPLLWALPYGICFGGNGTLIGASANVVAAGLAEQNGFPISFNRFFRSCFVIMIATTAVACVYSLVVHVWFGWE